MANYIARALTAIPDYKIAQVIVPTGVTLYAGSVVGLVAYPSGGNAISGNLFVYAAGTPATTSTKLGIVVNGSNFETLSDGRRPAGNPDFTTYEYKAGEVVTVILLDQGMRFEIAQDSLNDTTNIAVGNILLVTGGSAANYKLGTAAATANQSVELTILATNNFPVGGKFGGNFASTLICVVD